MSKQPANNHQDDDLPPSYTDSLTPTATGSGCITTPLLNPLSTHLSNLPAYIRQTQSIRANTQADRDLDVLDYILPHVEELLLSPELATTPSGLTELVLVPATAVSGKWELSGVTERKRGGDLVLVGRVEIPSGKGKESCDQKGWPGGGDKRDLLWWKDEAMTRRLAAYLQPKEPVKTERKQVRVEVEQTKKGKASLTWGRKKSESGGSTARPLPSSPALPRDDSINIRVRTGEVTFRMENDFGIWESMEGFAIVVEIRLRKR